MSALPNHHPQQSAAGVRRRECAVQRQRAASRPRWLPVANALRQMRALAGKLRARRQAKGCIDFEIEEPNFVLDENGEPVEIITRERGEAEMMIEDFMLAANECVARFARENRLPLLYRVHEKPDPEKLAMFADFLEWHWRKCEEHPPRRRAG